MLTAEFTYLIAVTYFTPLKHLTNILIHSLWSNTDLSTDKTIKKVFCFDYINMCIMLQQLYQQEGRE